MWSLSKHTSKLVLGVALEALACSAKVEPAPGEVLLLLSTDMQVPQSFDAIKLTNNLNQTSHAFSAQGVDNSNGDCSGATNNGSPAQGLAFPTTIALLSERDTANTLDLTLTACKAGKAIFSRKFAVAMPERGQIKMLRAPIRWLCTDWSNRCMSCNGSTGCHHESINFVEGDGDKSSTPCRTSACNDGDSGFYQTIDYDKYEVAQYEKQGTESGSCFDPSAVFSGSNGASFTNSSQFAGASWFHVPVGWSAASTTTGSSCSAAFESLTVDPSNLNLALVIPPTDKRFCDRRQCLIPLEARTAVGWTLDSSTDSPRIRIVLPDAVCHMLDSGQILYVVGADGIPTKPQTVPFCVERNKVEQNEAPTHSLEDTANIHISLDGQTSDGTQIAISDDSGRILSLAPTVSANLSSPQARKGRAGVFGHDKFALRESYAPLGRTFTISTWLSLTELSEDELKAGDDMTLPVLSNVAADCRGGVRLELRTCSALSKVMLALGVPTGVSSSEGCAMRYTFAPFASTTFNGGFYTPWQRGNWYHVAATLDEFSGEAALYVDGRRLDASTAICSSPKETSEPHDGTKFYLGASAAALANSKPQHDLLVDELMLFDAAFGSDKIAELLREAQPAVGASGLRWGAWGTRGTIGDAASLGSIATLSATDPVTIVVKDEKYSSAGTYAVLRTPSDSSSQSRLSDFDEAVLIASVPQAVPFQFSLVADHGRSQCTWQLTGNDIKGGSSNYVIDLTRPSWCNSPDCQFVLSDAETANIGSDWTSQSTLPISYFVTALAFRKRPRAEQPPAGIGAIDGLYEMCWKPVTYDPGWVIGPARYTTNPPTIGLPDLAPVSSRTNATELAVELPETIGRAAARCRELRLCVSVSLLKDFTAENNDNGPYLVLQNTVGQTWSVGTSSGCPAIISLDGTGSGWPGKGEPNQAAKLTEFQQYPLTRLSVRNPGPIALSSVQCCTGTDSLPSCVDLKQLNAQSSTSAM